MDMERPEQSCAAQPSSSTSYEIGTELVYGVHGRHIVGAIEIKSIGGREVSVYRLDRVKSPLSRSAKQEPSIWLPIESAHSMGLRTPLDSHQADEIEKVLASAEHFLNPSEPWGIMYPKIDRMMRTEGLVGIAKAYGFLMVVKRRQVVAKQEVARLLESVSKVLFGEITALTQETRKDAETRINKLLKAKYTIDQ